MKVIKKLAKSIFLIGPFIDRVMYITIHETLNIGNKRNLKIYFNNKNLKNNKRKLIVLIEIKRYSIGGRRRSKSFIKIT